MPWPSSNRPSARQVLVLDAGRNFRHPLPRRRRQEHRSASRARRRSPQSRHGRGRRKCRSLRIGWTRADELAERHAGFRSSKDRRQQGRIRRRPAIGLRRRRHVDHFEEIAALVQNGNRAMRARVNADDGRSGHPTTVSRFARFVERWETISPAGLKTYTKTCQAEASDPSDQCQPMHAKNPPHGSDSEPPPAQPARPTIATASSAMDNHRPLGRISERPIRHPSPARSVVEARAPCYPTSEKIWQRCLKICAACVQTEERQNREPISNPGSL